MDLGAHKHLFCSVLELKTWNELLLRELNDAVKEEDVVESEEVWSEKQLFSR